MSIIITILLAIICFILLILFIALFQKREIDVKREVVINRSRNEVFDYIKHLKNQNYYSKWATMDPNMKVEFIGEDGTVGFVSAWESKERNVGAGRQTISKIEEGERIDFDLHFLKPFESHAQVYMITEDASNQTRVKWGFYNKMKYPMNIMGLFLNMDKLVGNDFQSGLNRLKNILENKEN